jgi:ABC-type enterochelin transport system substrate-binding protein
MATPFDLYRRQVALGTALFRAGLDAAFVIQRRVAMMPLGAVSPSQQQEAARMITEKIRAAAQGARAVGRLGSRKVSTNPAAVAMAGLALIDAATRPARTKVRRNAKRLGRKR